VKTLSTVLAPVALAALVCAPDAAAQNNAPRYYTVANGDTLWDIARRFHVSASEIAERSHLTPPYALRRGMQLHLPGRAIVVPEAAQNAAPATPPAHAATAHPTPPTTAHPTAHPTPAPPVNNNHRPGGRWGRPSHPGVVHLKRVADDESIVVDLRRIGPVTRGRMRTFLRASNGATHAIDARLLRQVALVSDHFGGRTLEVISSFRPRRRGQFTAHSRHNLGHAIDFRVEGVSNRVLRDYCRTFAATGCGFYPRSVFVHMDTRDESAYWVDWSRPGERPRYGSESGPPPERPRHTANPIDTPDPSVPPAGADPELDDVADDAPRVRTDQPAPERPEENATEGMPTTP
jgi:uncharacterized protein YcbK (DUF882 family)/LysM repeat protein